MARGFNARVCGGDISSSYLNFQHHHRRTKTLEPPGTLGPTLSDLRGTGGISLNRTADAVWAYSRWCALSARPSPPQSARLMQRFLRALSVYLFASVVSATELEVIPGWLQLPEGKHWGRSRTLALEYVATCGWFTEVVVSGPPTPQKPGRSRTPQSGGSTARPAASSLGGVRAPS